MKWNFIITKLSEPAQNRQLNHVQGFTRDVAEGLDDTIIFIIDDAGPPALDPPSVSHFALASSHSLRGIDLFGVIPSFKLLNQLNSLLGLLVTFNLIFNNQRQF